MSFLDSLKEVATDGFRTAKDAYIEYAVAMKKAGAEGAVARQQSLTSADRTVPANATPMTPAQVASDAQRAAASFKPGLSGFWSGLQGWQKGVLAAGALGLGYMAVRGRR